MSETFQPEMGGNQLSVKRPKLPTEIKPSNTGEKVIVGCKLPNGLVLEHIDAKSDVNPQLPNWKPAPPGPRVVLNGSNAMRMPGSIIVAQDRGYFGMTEVDKSFWDKWIAHDTNRSYVDKGLIFVIATKGGRADAMKSYSDAAKERMKQRTGLEALSTEVDGKGRPTDPRMRQAKVDGASDITADPEHLAILRDQMANGIN